MVLAVWAGHCAALPSHLASVVGVQHGGHFGVHLGQSLVQLGSVELLQLRFPVGSSLCTVRRVSALLLRDAFQHRVDHNSPIPFPSSGTRVSSPRCPAGLSTAATRCNSLFLRQWLAACFCSACHLCQNVLRKIINVFQLWKAEPTIHSAAGTGRQGAWLTRP